MTELICKRNSIGYNFLSQTDFSLPQMKSLNHGLKALQYFGLKYEPDIYPSGIKNSRTLQELSEKLNHGFLKIVFAESVETRYIR